MGNPPWLTASSWLICTLRESSPEQQVKHPQPLAWAKKQMFDAKRKENSFFYFISNREDWANCPDRSIDSGDWGAGGEASPHCGGHAGIWRRHQQPRLVRTLVSSKSGVIFAEAEPDRLLSSSPSFSTIISYIDDQFERYLHDESGLNRRHIVDNRVHCCFYFISPLGHGWVAQRVLPALPAFIPLLFLSSLPVSVRPAWNPWMFSSWRPFTTRSMWFPSSPRQTRWPSERGSGSSAGWEQQSLIVPQISSSHHVLTFSGFGFLGLKIPLYQKERRFQKTSCLCERNSSCGCF